MAELVTDATAYPLVARMERFCKDNTCEVDLVLSFVKENDMAMRTALNGLQYAARTLKCEAWYRKKGTKLS